ncbi:hypothetical protein BC826DRAFT_737262 [Russula brevipes]|nr:hypothetical protein BC826DRAFT_737262 [Russula brevipes]
MAFRPARARRRDTSVDMSGQARVRWRRIRRVGCANASHIVRFMGSQSVTWVGAKFNSLRRSVFCDECRESNKSRSGSLRLPHGHQPRHDGGDRLPHRHFTHKLAPTIMHFVSSLPFRRLISQLSTHFNNALNMYEKHTKKNLLAHPLADYAA